MENFDSLKQIVYSGRVNAAEFTLAATLLGSEEINALAEKYLDKGKIALRNYQIAESEAEKSITVTGTGESLPFTGMNVTAVFQLQEEEATLRIEATITGIWNFSVSFPILKSSLLADLRFSPESGFTLASYDISDDIPKNTLFFDGTATLDSVLAGLGILFGNLGPRISGTIEMADGVPEMTLSTGEGAPIDIGFSRPLNFAFEACSEPVIAEEEEDNDEEPLPDAKVFFRFRTAIPFTARGKEYSIPMAAIIYDLSTQVVFSIDLESFTDFISAGISELTALTNQIPFADKLAGIEGFQLAEIVTLKNLFFYINPTGSSKLTSIALSIESKKPWTIIRYNSPSGKPIVIALDTLSILISIPTATKTPELSITGVIGVGTEGKIVLSLFTPELTIAGNLEPETKVSLKETLSYFIQTDLTGLPDVTVTEFGLFIQPGTGEFGGNGAVTGDWSLPLGILSGFALKELSFALGRTPDEGLTGTIAGKAAIGSATFDASYTFPGNSITIAGEIPSINLGELISTLCNNTIPLPDGLNFTLKDSEIAVTKEGSDYTFFLQTELEEIGTVFFQIQRTSDNGWGAAVGVDLSIVKKLGDLPGFGFMNAIDLTFERMALVLTSVDLPSGYSFPDIESYKPTKSLTTGGKVKIPSGIGTPKRGINFYGQFAFGDKAATRNESLLKLYDFFSIKRVVLDMAAQVSYRDGDLSVLLMAGAGVSGQSSPIVGSSAKYNMDLAAYLAIQFGSDGNAAIFLRGIFALAEPGVGGGKKLTFAMELGLQPNGLYIAGSMSGSWRNPFGIEGLTLSDVGLMVGINWQGIPSVGFAGALTVTGFQGSLACIVNSENPVNSVLAGSLSDLSLGDVLKTFAGLAGDPDPTLKEIIAVLNNVAVEGINSFKLPGTVADSLDKEDLKGVVAAFGQYGNVTLSPTPEKTMLVIGSLGKNWFITDKTGGVRHYQITRQGNELIVSQQAQLYLSPNTTRIATLDFPAGYRIYGQLKLFGLAQMSDITILKGEGVAVEVRMSEINFFNRQFYIGRAPKDTRGDNDRGNATRNGPYLSIATFSRPARPAPYNEPHVFVSGSLSFLGLVDQVLDIAVSSKGLHVIIKRNQFGASFDISFDFQTSPLSLSGGGSVGLNLNPKIDLSSFGMGTYTIANAQLGLTLAFGVSGEKLIATASGNFYFTIPEFNVRLGPYSFNRNLVDVDQPLQKLTGIFEGVIQEAGNIAQDLGNRLIGDAKRFAKLVEDGVITLTGSLDSVLRKVFNVTLADITATTQCFAEKRLVPQMEPRSAPPPAPPPPPAEKRGMLRATPPPPPPPPPPPSDDPLARLRQLRSDMEPYPMGAWFVNIYNRVSEPLVHLYDYKPSDPEIPTFREVLDTYNGGPLYRSLIDLLRSAGTSRPISLPNNFFSDLQNLIAVTYDLANAYAESGDPRRKREGTIIMQGITALLDQVSFAEQLQGQSYDQIKKKIAEMPAPPDPFTEG